MRRTTMVVTGVLLGASVLGGCGSSDDKETKGSASDPSSSATASGSSDYCKHLADAKDVISKFSGSDVPDAEALQGFIDDVGTFEDEAPADIADDWKLVGDRLDSLVAALDEAGLTLDDLVSAMATNQLPPGVSMDKLSALSQKVQNLADADFKKATAAIGAQAKSDCDLDLPLDD